LASGVDWVREVLASDGRHLLIPTGRNDREGGSTIGGGIVGGGIGGDGTEGRGGLGPLHPKEQN